MNIANKINFEKILAPTFKENGALQLFYKIAQNWEGFVEKSFVNITMPLKLTMDNNGQGILFIAVPNSSVSSQFYYSKEKIINNISLHLGYKAVVDVRTILKPLNEYALQISHSANEKDKNFSNVQAKEIDLDAKFDKLISSIRESF